MTGSDDVRTLASGRGTPLDRHDYEADTHTRDVVEHLSQEIVALRAEQSQLLALVDHREDGEIRSRRFARTATDR